MPKRSKKPQTKFNPPWKVPRTEKGVPSSFDAERPAWRFAAIDFDGPWGCGKLGADVIREAIHPKIRDFEGITWGEIKKAGSHSVQCQSLCSKARKRLERIRMDDIDELFCLRLTGKQRIWGIMERNILKFLWWDPHHTVCPSQKKYT